MLLRREVSSSRQRGGLPTSSQLSSIEMSNIALAVQHLQIVYRESTAQLAAAERVHCSEHNADPSQKRYTNPTRYASR